MFLFDLELNHKFILNPIVHEITKMYEKPYENEAIGATVR
jgi:hypothetical protein